MSAWRIVSDPPRVWEFVRQYAKVQYVHGMKALGLEKDGELVAGVLYEGFTGNNVWMHVGAIPGRAWLIRRYLRYTFQYPFDELGVRRITGYVEASNEEARRFNEHLGFRPEAVLKGAASDGGDVILYVMWREDCRYVDPK